MNTNQKTVNTINDRLIENIVYTVISRLNLSTGATGSSVEESIIDNNGILTSNIIPVNDNTINLGQTGLNLNSLYTHKLNIDNNEINSSQQGNIVFPYNTNIIGDIESSIIIKGVLPNISDLPPSSNNGDSYVISSNTLGILEEQV